MAPHPGIRPLRGRTGLRQPRVHAAQARRPSAAAVARASGYGMVSSSCSYAATAVAKSLFVKGADYLSAMVFMFASTNLVVELGIVLIVLLGWQFAVSEFVGGAIMIVLLVTFGGLWLRGRLVVAARERLTTDVGARSRARTTGEHRTAAAALGKEVALQRRLGRRGHLHDGRSHHAPAGAADRLCDRWIFGHARTRQRVERRVPARARLLDEPGERRGRTLHCHHQLCLLDRQRAVGCRIVERRHLVRWGRGVHLRRSHHLPAFAHLPALLRHRG